MDEMVEVALGTGLELSVPEETRKERFAAEFRANLEAFIAALERGSSRRVGENKEHEIGCRTPDEIGTEFRSVFFWGGEEL